MCREMGEKKESEGLNCKCEDGEREKLIKYKESFMTLVDGEKGYFPTGPHTSMFLLW